MSRNTVGVPYKNVIRYTGPSANIVPTVKHCKEPTILDKNHNLMTIWLVGDNPPTGTEGDLWYLSEFLNGDAIWKQFDTGVGGTGINFLRDQVNVQVSPDGSGNVDIDGLVVANAANPSGIPVETVAGTNKIDVQVQVGAAITGAPSDKNDAGIASFDDTMFTVDADGYVQLLGGGLAIDSVTVDSITAPGVNPVVPDPVTGNVTITGNAVTAHSVPIETHTRAINSYEIEAQYASAVSAADGTKSGLAHYNLNDFSVGATGFVSANPKPGAKNLGIAYDGGTGVFKVTSAGGTALSATNVGNVTLQSKGTPGQLVTIPVTSDQSFIDDVGASEIVNNLFGVTTGVAWAEDMPFFLYAVSNDDEDDIAFMISRVPHADISPVAASIGAPDNAVADSMLSFFSLENIVETVYDANPCICLGSFRMQKLTTADDWTVQTLTNADGIEKYHESTPFIYPKGQLGCSTNTYITINGGTEPQFTENIYTYWVKRSGLCVIGFKGTCSVTGVGAYAMEWTVPFPKAINVGSLNLAGDRVTSIGGLSYIFSTRTQTGNTIFTFYSNGGTTLPNTVISINDVLRFNGTFQISNSGISI